MYVTINKANARIPESMQTKGAATLKPREAKVVWSRGRGTDRDWCWRSVETRERAMDVTARKKAEVIKHAESSRECYELVWQVWI